MNQASISVLIAARNEAENIGACLESLANQTFTNSHFEVLIGDDASEDETALIIDAFVNKDARFKKIAIQKSDSNLQGKANVLAQLAHFASGDLFFIADADMIFPPSWIENMQMGFDSKTGMVNGVTVCTGNSVFSKIQAIDWLAALGFFSILNHFGISFTGLGNNMAISKEAYWKTGGYEKIPFSVTEDLALFQAVEKAGFTLRHFYHYGVLALTKPMKTLEDWLRQRKRWMVGLYASSFMIQIPFYSILLWYPLMALSYTLGSAVWFAFFLICTGIKWLLIAGFLWKMKHKNLIIWLPVFECSWPVLYGIVWMSYLFSPSIKWKGRSFSKA